MNRVVFEVSLSPLSTLSLRHSRLSLSLNCQKRSQFSPLRFKLVHRSNHRSVRARLVTSLPAARSHSRSCVSFHLARSLVARRIVSLSSVHRRLARSLLARSHSRFQRRSVGVCFFARNLLARTTLARSLLARSPSILFARTLARSPSTPSLLRANTFARTT